MDRPRVLLADDHAPVLQMVHDLLEPQCDVVGMVEDGKAVVAAAQRLRPDVIVLDISMPVMSGIEAARRLAKTGARIVFLTLHFDPELVEVAFDAGALAYVVKERAAEDLLPAIHEALEGRIFVSPLDQATGRPNQPT